MCVYVCVHVCVCVCMRACVYISVCVSRACNYVARGAIVFVRTRLPTSTNDNQRSGIIMNMTFAIARLLLGTRPPGLDGMSGRETLRHGLLKSC